MKMLKNLWLMSLVLSMPCMSAPVEKSHTVNLHTVSRIVIESMIYRLSTSLEIDTETSRMGMSFHSIVDDGKKRRTYALDHCHNPGDKSKKIKAVLVFKGIVKNPDSRCSLMNYWSLKKTIQALKKDPVYFRITQHSDELKMIEGGQFSFQWDFKLGNPIKKSEMETGLVINHHTTTKTLAYKVDRWLTKSCKKEHIDSQSFMSPIHAGKYPDMLLGMGCSVGIMEVLFINKNRQSALVFFDFSVDSVLILESVEKQEHSYADLKNLYTPYSLIPLMMSVY